MNCPSRVDEEALPNGWNQSPSPLALQTNNDMNGRVNTRRQHDHRIQLSNPMDHILPIRGEALPRSRGKMRGLGYSETAVDGVESENGSREDVSRTGLDDQSMGEKRRPGFTTSAGGRVQQLKKTLVKFGGFVGPGFMISVAYIDPGNYSTDVVAGATFKFKLLVMVLMSNIIAIFLQSLCIKLGSVTGMNLAENIKAHCPPWLNYILYFFAEAAIIATDIAEVIGTAIALNLLIKVPLVAGCAISIVDVLIILFFYRPNGAMRGIRLFEIFVGLLVLGVVICFCIELSLVSIPDPREVLRGYLPSSVLVNGKGLYQACGILGATVMPHSLYLGSGLVQPRLLEYDSTHGNIALPDTPPSNSSDDLLAPKYKPSLAAIRSCLSYSIAELTISLFTFALFVNSAILVVAGASLADNADATDADLFGIHDLLASTLAPAAGTVFALALLLSGTSAGIICTLAGQMISEGQLNLAMKPWVRRLLTRSISITPSIIIAGAVGQEGLSAALEGSQVALSVILPIVSAPLIYFTCRERFMKVEDGSRPEGFVSMRNGWITAGFAVALWVLIVVMIIASWVLTALGSG